MNALEIKDLSKSRNQFHLNQINFTLPMGYILGYVGENGAGKTTTIKCILNLLKKDSGRIKVADLQYNENPKQYLDSIGYISDECNIPSQFTRKELIKTMKEFYPSFNETIFLSYCKQWNLPEGKKISELSKGMQVRLMFACILSRKTKLLVLDEATSGLDPVIRNDILELLQKYIQDGEHSVLLSTHILSDLEKIADYICFIDQGNQIFYKTVDDALEDYRIVKGGSSDFEESIKKNMIGGKFSHTGFEVLISSDNLPKLTKHMIIERPTIEQIILFSIKGTRRQSI